MKTHIQPAIIALLIGLIGVAVFFVFGSFSGRGEIGLIATFVLYLINCALLVGWHPMSWWYAGTVINIPIWCLLIFWAEAGQFDHYFWGLIALLIDSYAGSFIGFWFARTINKEEK